MKEEKDSLKGSMLVFTAGLLWGTIGIFVKEMSLYGADALFISFIRVTFACAVMFIFTVLSRGFGAFKISGRQIFFSALLGIVCQGIYNIFYSYAVTMAGVSVSAVLLNIAPVVTMFVSMRVFSEKINAAKIAAIVLNVTGCVLTVTGGNFSVQTFSATGIACGVGAGICYAMTAILGRIANEDTDAFVSSTYSYLFAALLLIIPAKPYNVPVDGNLAHILFIGFMLAVIPTAIAYVIYYKGLTMIKETGRVPVIASGETVVAAVLGVVLYNEQLNVVSIVGILLVLASIVFMN